MVTPVRLVLVLPLPPRALHVNSRVHWKTKWKAGKEYRYSAFLAGCRARQECRWIPGGKVRITAVFYFKTKRNRDGDNLISWTIAAVNGLRDAGVIVDDSTEHVEWGNPEAHIHVLNPRLELVIERIPEQEVAA